MKKRYYLAVLFAMTVAVFTGCSNTDKAEKTTTAATEAKKQYTACVVYAPDDQAEELVSEKVKVESIDENTLLKELQNIGTLNKKIEILSYEKNDKQITIDFNQSFEEYFKAMGSAEEGLKMEALAKTFCENLNAEAFSFTVEGETLETGHQIYDEPIGVK